MKEAIITLENQLEVGAHFWGSENEETILLLHGLGSTGASFVELATSLSAKYRILALDLPGHGNSTSLQDEKSFSAKALADWVMAVLKHLNIREIHIAGHSIGGNIGLAIAKKNVIKSLVLLDGGYLRSSSIVGNTLEEEVRMAEQHCKGYVFSSWEQFETDLKGEGVSEPLIELAKAGMVNDGKQIKMILQSDVAGIYMKQHFYEPTEETLTNIMAPVLLLRSTLPLEFNVHRKKETDRLHQYLNVTAENVKNASHDIYWEQPEVICAYIDQWIAKCG